MSRAAIRVLSRHGRTFRLAGRLLARAELDAAAELYAFCRAVDDLADEAPDPISARAALLALRAEVAQSGMIQGGMTQGGSSALALRFAALRACPSATVGFIDAMLGDFGPVRVADEAQLLRYAYGAAGTVGVLMCGVLGVRDPAAAPHAVDLGIAMQLTNIARDVMEDSRRDRLYLPASWLPAGFGPADVGGQPQAVFAAVQRLLALADRHYRSAAHGYRYLSPRTRLAIRVAGRLYEEIGRQVLARGPAYLAAGRCVVPTRRKLALFCSQVVAAGREARPRPPSAGRLNGPRQSAEPQASFAQACQRAEPFGNRLLGPVESQGRP